MKKMTSFGLAPVFATLIFCFLSCVKLMAGTVSGGYLTYKLLPSDSADIMLVAYRICTGVPFGTTVQTVLKQGSTTMMVTLNRISVIDVTEFCSTSKSLCAGGTVAGYEENRFINRVSLAAFSSGTPIQISYQECCYNSANATIAYGDLYLESYFVKNIGNNEGPIFGFQLPLIWVSGIQNFYNAHLINSDRDSIVYNLVPALTTSGANATYSGSYSVGKPLPYNGSTAFALQFDNKTGQLRAGSSEGIVATGSANIYLLSYSITRYRNGTQIGMVRVCHEVNVLNNSSNNSTPVLSASSATYKVCAGTTICFDLYTSDPNQNDSTDINWDHSIAGAFLQSNSLKNAKGTFCWTPSANDIRTEPYYVTFRTGDNSCSKRVFATKTITIQVDSFTGTLNATATAAFNYCTGKVDFQSSVSGSGGNYQYQWAGTNGFTGNTQNVTYSYPTLGKKYFSVRISSLQTCGDFIKNDSVIVTNHIPLSASINGKTDTIACSATPLLLTASPIGGRQPYSYVWNGGTVTTMNSYSFQSTQPGVVTLLMTDSFGCSKTAQINVGIRALPNVSILFPDTAVCYNSGNVSLSAQPSGGNWISSSSCFTGNVLTPKLSCAGLNTIIYRYTDSSGCANNDTAHVTILNSILSQTGSYNPVCYNAEPVQLNGMPANGYWSGNGILGNKFYPSLAGVGNHTISYQASGGCGTLASTFINVLYSAIVSFNNPTTTFCETSNQVYVFANPSGGSWSGNNILSNGTFNPAAAGSGSHQVTYTYTYSNGCVSNDSLILTVEKLPSVNAGSDRKACINSGDIALIGFPSGGNWSGNSVAANKFNSSIPAGSYKLVYTYSGLACTNKDTMQMNVIAADFYSLSVLGLAPFTVNFTNNSSPGFSDYLWNFGDSLSGANNSSVLTAPSHTYQNQGAYTVKLTAISQAENCSTSVTKASYINVNPNGVFTPDGKNKLLVYPNPSSTSSIQVNWLSDDSHKSETYSLSVYDMSGKLIHLQQGISNTEYRIPVSIKGLYLMKVENEQGDSRMRKFIIQ